MKKLNIWVDITNAPHVLFFKPIIFRLKKLGHKVWVTTRDFSQTIDLLNKFEIDYIIVGEYGGKSIFGKFKNLFLRSKLLYKLMKGKKINLSLSHNSVDICIVSKLLRVPVINAFDYEHAWFHHINIRLSKKFLCPKYISEKSLLKYGARNKVIHYKGLKEQFYFYDYKFNKNILQELNIDNKKIIVVLRPPAETSLYHLNTKNKLYYELADFLGQTKNTQVVFLGRTDEQRKYVLQKKFSNFLIPTKAIDLPSLIKKADLVISAGGTVNRESVVLGTPVYTIIAIKLGAVDEYLIKSKKMFHLKNISDLKLKKKKVFNELDLLNPNKLVEIYLTYVK